MNMRTVSVFHDGLKNVVVVEEYDCIEFINRKRYSPSPHSLSRLAHVIENMATNIRLFHAGVGYVARVPRK